MHIPINLRETDFKPWLIWGYSMKQTMCKSLPFEVCLHSHSFNHVFPKSSLENHTILDDIHKINIFLATTHGKIKHPGWHWPYFLRKWTSSSKVVPKSRRNGFVPTPMARRWLYPFHIYHETNLVNMKQTGKPLLVGGWPTPLKNMSSSVGITIPIIWKVIKFHGSTPPTRLWCWRKSHNSPT